MHRIEIIKQREKQKKKTTQHTEREREYTTIDNKNIYNLTLGVVMDFRVYFEPIMLPLKVRMDPLNKCFDSIHTHNKSRSSTRLDSTNIIHPIRVEKSTEKEINIDHMHITAKSKSNSIRGCSFFLMCSCVGYEIKFVIITAIEAY